MASWPWYPRGNPPGPNFNAKRLGIIASILKLDTLLNANIGLCAERS
jgi:hypothetical protein